MKERRREKIAVLTIKTVRHCKGLLTHDICHPVERRIRYCDKEIRHEENERKRRKEGTSHCTQEENQGEFLQIREVQRTEQKRKTWTLRNRRWPKLKTPIARQ